MAPFATGKNLHLILHIILGAPDLGVDQSTRPLYHFPDRESIFSLRRGWGGFDSASGVDLPGAAFQYRPGDP